MKIFFVDPMSYNNLSKYDRGLLNNIDIEEKYFYCSDKLEFEDFDNTRINRIFKYNEKKGFMKGFSYICSIVKLILAIRRHKPNIIHFQWFKVPYIDWLLVYIIKKILNVKVVFTAHNVLPHDSGEKYFKIYKKIYEEVDALIVHTERTKQELITKFGLEDKNIDVIPHGILELINNSKNNTNKSNTNNKVNFSFLGYLSYYKGIDLLIDAWNNSEILKTSKDIHLTIAGKGKVNFKNINYYENVTIINRFLEEEELKSIINNTDVVVMPYRKISQSGVLLSILKERKAILVSDVGGLTEPFQFGDVGWILDHISADSLQMTLENIIKQKEKITLIKNNDEMWDKINNYYDWFTIGQKTKKLYQELLKS